MALAAKSSMSSPRFHRRAVSIVNPVRHARPKVGRVSNPRRPDDTVELRRQSAARAGLVALGVGAGTGLLTALLLVVASAGGSPLGDPGTWRFASIAVVFLLGLVGGIAAGAVLAVPASLATLLLRPQMVRSPRRARVVAGLLGAVGAAALVIVIRFWWLSSEFLDASLVWNLVIPAGCAVAASAWAGPWIANRPVSGPRPGRSRFGASPR